MNVHWKDDSSREEAEMGRVLQHGLWRSRRANRVGWLLFVLLLTVLVSAVVRGVASLQAA